MIGSGRCTGVGAATPGSYNLNEPLVIRAWVYAPIIANGTNCR